MSSPGKGGRGKTAPYSTIHYRIPEPIKASVERFAHAYRILVGSDNLEGCNRLIKSVDDTVSKLDNSDNEMEHLKIELSKLMREIEVLKTERERTVASLLPVLSMKSRDGVKMKEAILAAFPELANQNEFRASDKRRPRS